MGLLASEPAPLGARVVVALLGEHEINRCGVKFSANLATASAFGLAGTLTNEVSTSSLLTEH